MKTIEDIIENHIESGFFSGAVCSISLNGEDIYKKSFGFRNVVTEKKCNMNTLFDLASITKVFTSTLILRLITENRLSLYSILGVCLPKVKDKSALRNITIYQLLTHSSGLVAWYPFYTKEKLDFFEVLDTIELKNDSANMTVYSDLNFMLLGKVVERTLNMPLEKAIDVYFIKELGFSSASYKPTSAENIAACEFGNQIEKKMCSARNLIFEGWRDENKPMVGEVNDGNSYYFFNGISGHAGIFSQVDDLMKLGNLYVGFQNKCFISSELLEASKTLQIEDRGLGWDFGNTFPEGFGHTGFTGTALWIVPERNLVVGLLTNRLHSRNPHNVNPFRTRVFEEILKQL
ncbi:serine hydrolase domain-containing protein [Sporosarcina aquimarina]|uniref:Serine hydrolase domain-containing protein n=1 Tax=Sporosarcina aquimarina TaxID=114975 RepID=A0ABU4FZN7_9BACL|nr:serine hydrolase domain-containing protein [Sporosarcina aquimarina]MDW0108877.1 serine hydrolase domain-containing protein [Sporosarcina aquimarina]